MAIYQCFRKVKPVENPFAVEVKYDEARIKAGKYKKFIENYPDIPLSYNYLVRLRRIFSEVIKSCNDGYGFAGTV